MLVAGDGNDDNDVVTVNRPWDGNTKKRRPKKANNYDLIYVMFSVRWGWKLMRQIYDRDFSATKYIRYTVFDIMMMKMMKMIVLLLLMVNGH